MGQLDSTLEYLPGVGDDGAIQAPDAGSRWRRCVMKSGCDHEGNHAIMYAIGRRRHRVKVGVIQSKQIQYEMLIHLLNQNELGARHRAVVIRL